MELTILGFNSALPTAYSNPTSQVLNICERNFLIDCGEGTQKQLRRSKIKFAKINHIFISHLHGDHVFGLVGLVSSLNLLGRHKPLMIFGPKGIKKFIEVQLEVSNAHNSFELIFKELESKDSELIFEDDKVEVHTIPLTHRVYCNGYLFKEKPKSRKLNIKAIKKHPEIDVCDYQNIKNGKDFVTESKQVIANDLLTFDADTPMQYAFCSDTEYLENPIEILQNTDVIYHESTFLHQDLKVAKRTGHSTALQAGMFAQKINAKALILGHFSNRYTQYHQFKEEAEKEFKNVIIPQELETYTFKKLLNLETQS